METPKSPIKVRRPKKPNINENTVGNNKLN